jgi:hypothetical protein
MTITILPALKEKPLFWGDKVNVGLVAVVNVEEGQQFFGESAVEVNKSQNRPHISCTHLAKHHILLCSKLSTPDLGLCSPTPGPGHQPRRAVQRFKNDVSASSV